MGSAFQTPPAVVRITAVTLRRSMAGDERNRPGLGTAVLGGGPAGLTSAWVLAQRNEPATVLEADGTVGGIAKTVEFEGYRFDLGGHRFYTKLAPVQHLWEEMLGDQLLTRPRMSRIYHRGRFFNYPLRAADVLSGLGPMESIRCGLSYFYWRRKLKNVEPRSFEDWVVRRFGRRLYDAFFRSYTEKVWGIPGSEIQAEWAAQRIQEFSLLHAIMGILRLDRLRRAHAPTLIEEFLYPRLGPGQMWEAFRDWVGDRGIETRVNNRVVAIRHAAGRATSVVVRTDGHDTEHEVDGVLSSIPLSELIESLDPPAPVEVRAAARQLRYRGLCLIALMTSEEEPFPDNWIYLHDARTQAGRVQNFGAWSADMVPAGATCLGVEYFCNEGDDIWDMSDEKSVRMATEEMETIGVLDSSKVFNGVKVRVPKAYPMYDQTYREAVAEIRGYLEHFENLRTFGRNGLHRYNNQDHSMWTAILATLSYTDGISRDVWSVNTKAEYLEEGPLAEGLADLDLVA
jgi:protoporphyrinogen oxidase